MTGYKKKFKLLLPVIIFIIFQITSFLSFADDQPLKKSEVKDIKHWSAKGYTRVVVEFSEPITYISKRISGPDRLYFDLQNTKISKEINTALPVGDGILKTVRAGQFNSETVRVVLDLEEIDDFHSFFMDDPAKLVIDVYGTTKKTKQPAQKPEISPIIIVIDPGHGGHDPGAVGGKGLYEKDVVLDIGLKLKKVLSENKNIKVYMTRDRDVFIPLVERTAFANTKNADLFVSIHANASPSRNAKGVETYLLNWTTDNEAIRVSARENAISVKKMKEHMNRYKSDVDKIVGDFKRGLKRDESIKLAGHIHKTLVSTLDENYSKTKDLGVKNALFFVLFGAKMPSVLAEVSFISNPVEEKLLKKDSYRGDIAKALAKGIHTYLSKNSADQKIAKLR
ncbi:MAG: N-acetylmuramoyl-L-alanine amidase [Nitrospiraceae bacterium]|nr:N-acetylmuramoyl-L-alanine amidase [Nitrospiraceae bacterium]